MPFSRKKSILQKKQDWKVDPFIDYSKGIPKCVDWKPTGSFCDKYDKRWTTIHSFKPETPQKWSQPTPIPPGKVEAWDGYCPKCTVPGGCDKFSPCQTKNIKKDGIYDGIEVQCDKWARLANEEAKFSVKHGGGPFGSVILRIDKETDEIIEYWKSHNHVVVWSDPTAHAEVSTIRIACADLAKRFKRPVFDLGEIEDPVSKRKSYCAIYVNAEPCPMCYTAINWARIPILIFSGTRFDSAVPGIEFSDAAIYEDLARPYTKRKNIKAMQADCGNSLDAFNLWRRDGCILPYEGHKPST